MKLKHMLPRVPNYVRRFGWGDGLRLLSQIERRPLPRTGPPRSYSVPGFDHPIWLRESVSDHSIFFQCVTRDHYDLRGYPQHGGLLAAYDAALAAGQTPVIIDGGGNVGLAALGLARAFPRARIVTVEPDPDNYEILRRNVAPLGARVLPVIGGVWSHSTPLVVYNQEAGAAAVRVRPAGPGEEGHVRAYGIADLWEMAGGAAAGPLLVVKLDVEGSQADLFAENTGWLGAAHLVLLELEDYLFPWEGNSRSFFRALADHPYDYIMHGDTMACYRHA